MSTLTQIRKDISRLHGRLILKQLDVEKEKAKIVQLCEKLTEEHDILWDGEPTEDEIKKISDYQEKLRQLLEATSSSKIVAELPKINLKFSGKPQDWTNFSKLFEASTSTASTTEKFMILTNALPYYLRRDLPTTPSIENINQIINTFNIRFGTTDPNSLEIVENLKFNDKTPLNIVAAKLNALYYQAIENDINEERIDHVFRKKIMQSVNVNTLKHLPMRENIESVIEKMAEISLLEKQAWNAKTTNQFSNRQRNNNNNKCTLCHKNNHMSTNCRAGSTKSRRQNAQNRRLCLKCLKPNHRANECRSNITCSKCKGQHATCLCEKMVNLSELVPDNDDQVDNSNNSNDDSLIALN